jgi:hypothetical protein
LVGAESVKALSASSKSLQLLWSETPLLYKQQLLRRWLGEAAAAAGATAAEAARARDVSEYRDDNKDKNWNRQAEEDEGDSESDSDRYDCSSKSEDEHPSPSYTRHQANYLRDQARTKIITCWLLNEGCHAFGLVALPTALDLQGALLKARPDEEMVQLLVRAGARVSEELLLSALQQGVQGIEVWVAAHTELGLATGLHPASLAVLLGRNVGVRVLLQEGGTGAKRSKEEVFTTVRYALAVKYGYHRVTYLDCLAAEGFSQEMVWELLQILSHQPHALIHVRELLRLPAAVYLPPQDIQQLLLAAAVRSMEQGHTFNLRCVARALDLEDRDSQAATAPVLQQLLDQAFATQDPGVVEVLLSLGAWQLSSDQVFQLLLRMLQQRLLIRGVLGMLWKMIPEMVAQLTPDQVKQLCQQAAKPHSTRQLEALLKQLPAAADAFGDLQSLIKMIQVMKGRKLRRLTRSLKIILSSAPAKDALNTEAGAVAVLDSCFRYGGREGEWWQWEEREEKWNQLFEMLRKQLPAVEELSEAALLRLARQLMSGGYRDMCKVQCPPIVWLPALLQLPAGQGLSAASLGELVGVLSGVGGWGAKTCLQHLMKHAAAKEVPGEELLGYLLAAAEEPARFLEELARVVGEKGVMVQRLEELMRSALRDDVPYSGKVRKLALIPVASQLSSETLKQLLLEPVEVDHDAPPQSGPSDYAVCKHAAVVWLPLLHLEQAARHLPQEVVVGLVQRMLLLDCSGICIGGRHSSSYEVLLQVLQLPWVAQHLPGEVWMGVGDKVISHQLNRDGMVSCSTDQDAKAVLELVGQQLTSEELLQLLLCKFEEGHTYGNGYKPALPDMVFGLKGVQALATQQVAQLLGAAMLYKRALQRGLLKLLVAKEPVTIEQLLQWVQRAMEQQYWDIGTLMRELQQRQQLKLPVEVAYQVLLQATEVPKKYRIWGHTWIEGSGWKQVLEQQPALTQQQVENLLHLVCAPSIEGGTDEALDLLHLLRLPAALCMGVEEVVTVLHYLHSHKDPSWCRNSFWCVVLQHFPAVQLLPLEKVLQHLLWEAGRGGFPFSKEKLAGFSSWLLLPVMQQMTPEGAFLLLQATLGNTSALEVIVTVPASQQMTLPQVLALLQGAICKQDKAAFAILFKHLRAVKQLGVQQLHELLLLALPKDLSSIADVVVEQLPEACQDLSAGQVKGLVALGLTYMKNPLPLLCLPAAADLPALELFHLLYMSARLKWRSLETLLKLPAAQQLDPEQVRCILHAALRADNCSVALVLDQVPAAKQLTTATCAVLLLELEKAAENLWRHLCNSYCAGENDMTEQQVLGLKAFADHLRDKTVNSSAGGVQAVARQTLGRIDHTVARVEVAWQERIACRSSR